MDEFGNLRTEHKPRIKEDVFKQMQEEGKKYVGIDKDDKTLQKKLIVKRDSTGNLMQEQVFVDNEGNVVPQDNVA